MMCPITQGAGLGQRSEQQPFQLWPVGESGSHHRAEPAVCGERDGQGGQGPSASSPSTPERMLSLSLGRSLSNEENSCPCPQKAELKGQPLAFSAVPACMGLRQRWQHRPRNTTVGTGLAQSLMWLGIRPRQAG